MIVANIETFPLRIPFQSGAQAAASAWGDKGLPVADSLLVKVTTDQGLEGWGETVGFRAVSSSQLAIDELIAPLCIGRDATQIGLENCKPEGNAIRVPFCSVSEEREQNTAA
jgi:L-alanine-DL-glutamate epimerase-like enolase superfamily enzyme